MSSKFDTKIDQNTETGEVCIMTRITKTQMSEIETPDAYQIRREVENKLADLLANKYFEKNKEELLKSVSFEDIKSIVMIQLGKDLLKALSDQNSRNY